MLMVHYVSWNHLRNYILNSSVKGLIAYQSLY